MSALKINYLFKIINIKIRYKFSRQIYHFSFIFYLITSIFF